MTIPAKLRMGRELLAAMIGELKTNRTILDELVDCYGMFRFTGGVVPRKPWKFVAIDAYRQCPLAADAISTTAIEQYQQRAEAIAALGQAITAEAGPMTLRSRYAIADSFDRDSSAMRGLADSLEPAVSNALDTGQPAVACQHPAGDDGIEGTARQAPFLRSSENSHATLPNQERPR